MDSEFSLGWQLLENGCSEFGSHRVRLGYLFIEEP